MVQKKTPTGTGGGSKGGFIEPIKRNPGKTIIIVAICLAVFVIIASA